MPVVFSRTAHESFRLPKLLFSEILGLASLGFLSWRLRAVERVDLRAFFRQPVVLATLPMLALASSSLLTSEHSLHVREALVSLWIGAACLVGWSLGLSEDEHRRLLRGLALPATVLAVLAILQFHGWFTPFEFERNVGERIGLTSLAGGAFDLAAYLVLPCLLMQASLRAERSAPRRLGWALAAAVCVYAMVATQTLTALLGLVAGSLMLWFTRLPRRRFLALAAALALAGVAVGVGFAPLRQRLERKLDSLRAGDVNTVLTGRLDGWRAAAWMLRQSPATGVGHGAYRAEYGNAKGALSAQGVKFYPRQHRVYFTNAHSDVLEALAEWGLAGAVVLVWGGFLVVRSLRRLAGSGASSAPELIAAVLVVLTLLALTNFPFRIALVAYPALLFLSWIFAAERQAAGSRRGRDGNSSPGGRAAIPGRRLFWVLLPLLVAALVLEVGRARRLAYASRIAAVVKDVTIGANLNGRLSRRLLESNLELLRATEPLSPVEVALPIARGGQYLLLQRPKAAIRAYEHALTIEPRGEIYVHLGRAYLQLGEREAAEQAFRTAMVLDHTQRKRVRGFVSGPEQPPRRQAPRTDEEAPVEAPATNDSTGEAPPVAGSDE